MQLIEVILERGRLTWVVGATANDSYARNSMKNEAKKYYEWQKN